MSNIIIINNEKREMTTNELNSHNELIKLIEDNNNQLKIKEDKKIADAKNNAINKKLTSKLTRRSYHTPDLKAIRTYAYVRPGQACCGEFL